MRAAIENDVSLSKILHVRVRATHLVLLILWHSVDAAAVDVAIICERKSVWELRMYRTRRRGNNNVGYTSG